MITVTVLKNPFDYSDKEVHACEYISGKTAHEYVQPYIMGLDDYVVSINGHVAEDTKEQTVDSDDWLAVCPVVGKSGSDWFRSIFMIALSFYAGQWTAKWFPTNTDIGKFWGHMAAGAVGAIGGALISHWFPAAKADRAKVEVDPSYNWGSAHAQTGQGNALAVTYGTMRTTGQVLAQHVSSDDENQYLNILLCGGEGPIDSISDIRINDNPISYYKDVSVETRLGANDQTAISNFNDTYVDQSLAYELETDGTWTTQQTAGNAVEGLEITIELPYGLYHVRDDGGLENASVSVEAQYRKVGDANWNTLTTATITAAKNTSFFRTYRIDNLTASQYEVRFQCTSKSGTDTRYSTRVYWTQLSNIMYDDFARPGKVLLGIKALATSQLSGSMPSITWLQTRGNVWVWNSAAGQYEQKSAANPAWAAYDMIHRCRRLINVNTSSYEYHVAGSPASRIVYQDFANWAAFCDGRGLTFNYIFDTANDLWTSLQKPEGVGRGKVILRGTRFGCVCDAPGEPVQLFTVGNIITDKFKETFVSQKDRANAIEISFTNKDKSYQREVITAYADDYDEATEPNITQITLDGATTVEQAYREGKYRLRLNQHLQRTVEHSADIDAIACQINDIVLLAHDVPQWGYSGRLLAATATTLQLDRQVTLKPGKAYAVALQITNPAAATAEAVQSIVTVSVQGVAQETSTDTVTLASPLAIVPQQWDLYSFGETTKVVKPFRVLNISRDQDLRRKITCIEYIEEVYNEATDIPEVNYSELAAAMEVSSVSVAEETYRQKDGTMISDLNVAWSLPRNGRVRGYAVLYSSDQGQTWTEWAAGITARSTVITGVRTGTEYIVKVCTHNELGVRTKGTLSPAILIVGKDKPPSNVGSLVVSYDSADSTKIILSWPPVTDIDLAGYRIREGARVVENLAQITTYTYHALESREHVFTVHAVDNSGNESAVAAIIVVPVTVEPDVVQNFTAGQRAADRSYVDLAWTANTDTDLSHYEIRMGSNLDWDEGTVIASQLKATSFSYRPEKEGYTYFLIKAVNASGFYSRETTETALQVSLRPDAVTNLTAVQSARDKSMVLVSWDRADGEDIAGYRIAIGEDVYFTRELSYSYEVRGNGPCHFAVQAVTTAGHASKATNCEIVATVSAMDVTGFRVHQSGTDRTKAVLSWDTPTELDVSHYIIKRGAAWETAALLSSRITGTSFETTVDTEDEQTFLLKAVTGAGHESQYPAVASAVFSLNPDPVTDIVLRQSSTDKSVLNIAWTGILESDFAHYDVRVGSVWEEAELIATTKETSCTYKLKATGPVKVLIKAMNVARFYSDEVTAVLYCTVEPLPVEGFRVYQNGEQVELYWNKSGEADVVGYEIREGANFDTGSLVVTGQTTTSYKYMVDTERNYLYHIKAINQSGFYSVTAASGGLAVTDLPVRNIVAAFDEITRQSGIHQDTAFGVSQYKFNNLGGRFCDYPATKFSEIGGGAVLKLAWNGAEYASSGTYTCDTIDLGKVVTANITAYFVSTVLFSAGVSAVLQYRSSLNGSLFTEWKDFTPGQATFRYLDFRVLLATTDTAKTPEVNHLTISLDVPDTELVLSVAVAPGGTTVEYGHEFYTVPVVTPTAIGEDLHAGVIAKTPSAVTLKVKNSANVDVGGMVDVRIRGY